MQQGWPNGLSVQVVSLSFRALRPQVQDGELAALNIWKTRVTHDSEVLLRHYMYMLRFINVSDDCQCFTMPFVSMRLA